VKYLLDTHTLLWFLLNDTQLSGNAKSIIADSSNDVFVSPASYWEIAIKISLGKYKLEQPFAVFFEQELINNRFSILPITIQHAETICTLPFHHRDPFDRLLIAQVMVEDIPLISNDKVFEKYSIARLW
jgi:PIN domain nuclease of toxin-antitoxin system